MMPPADAASVVVGADDFGVAVGGLLAAQKVAHISWHTNLNNHASTRPKMHGGILCRAVTECKQYTVERTPGSGSVVHKCTLT